jgi:hypothetical protein
LRENKCALTPRKNPGWNIRVKPDAIITGDMIADAKAGAASVLPPRDGLLLKIE